MFEGNELNNIDPYLCLPDPNVAIHDHQNGEFFGWLVQSNYLDQLTKERNDGIIFNVKYLNGLNNRRSVFFMDKSDREKRFGGAGKQYDSTVTNRVDNINMVVKLIPAEWKLGKREYREKWSFTLSADEVIIKAKPLDLDHL